MKWFICTFSPRLTEICKIQNIFLLSFRTRIPNRNCTTCRRCISNRLFHFTCVYTEGANNIYKQHSLMLNFGKLVPNTFTGQIARTIGLGSAFEMIKSTQNDTCFFVNLSFLVMSYRFLIIIQTSEDRWNKIADVIEILQMYLPKLHYTRPYIHV